MKRSLVYLFKLIVMAVLVALLVSLFQFLSHEVIHYSQVLLNHSSVVVVVLTIVLATFSSVGLLYLNRKFPGAIGSGIPQFEAYHAGWYEIKGTRLLILIFVNSLVAFFGGFCLGGEGPSISISSSLGVLVNKWFKSDEKEDVAICGSAGFASAFLSPLAGLFHLIEENKNYLSFKFVLKGAFVLFITSVITYFIYNHNLLGIYTEEVLPFSFYYVLVFVVIFSVIFGKLFVLAMVKMKDISKSNKYFMFITPVLMLIFILLKKFYPLIMSSGSSIITSTLLEYSIWYLIIILAWRIFSTALSANVYVSGGIVLPILALGVLNGDIIVRVVSLFDDRILDYQLLISIISMLSIYAVVCKTPFTALFLGFKVATIESFLLPLSICLLFSMLIVKLFKWENVYKLLEKRLPGYVEEL